MTRRWIAIKEELDFDGLRWAGRTIEFGVSLGISAAFNEMTIATVLLREHKDLYQKKVKSYCHQANDKAAHAEVNIKKAMINQKFWEDFKDHIIDAANTDISKFRIAVKQIMDAARYPHSEMVSHAETARCLLEMCVSQFELCIEEARAKFAQDYSIYFSEYKVNDVLFHWTKMCQLLYGGYEDDVNLNSPQATQAFDILCRKFADGAYMWDCFNEAEKQNPEFVKFLLNK